MKKAIIYITLIAAISLLVLYGLLVKKSNQPPVTFESYAYPEEKGYQIAKSQNCLKCHMVFEASKTAPNFHAIAIKEMDPSKTEQKIKSLVRNGIKSPWGQVQMPAYDAAQLSGSDLVILSDWIIQLPK